MNARLRTLLSSRLGAAVITIALFFTLVTPPATADDSAVRTQLQAQYAKIEQAFVQKDINTLKMLLAPDFTATIKTARKKGAHAPQSKITHDQMLHGWQGWFTVLKSIASQSHTITALKVHGNKATALVQYAIVFTEDHGRQGLRKADIRGPGRDTWIKSAGGWKWLRAEDLGSTVKSAFEKQHKPASEGDNGK